MKRSKKKIEFPKLAERQVISYLTQLLKYKLAGIKKFEFKQYLVEEDGTWYLADFFQSVFLVTKKSRYNVFYFTCIERNPGILCKRSSGYNTLLEAVFFMRDLKKPLGNYSAIKNNGQGCQETFLRFYEMEDSHDNQDAEKTGKQFHDVGLRTDPANA